VQIKQIQADEQEANTERGEYEAEISQQLNELDKAAAEILVGLRAGVGEEERARQTPALQGEEALAETTAGWQRIDGLHTAGQGDRGYNKEPLRSYFLPSASVNKPIIAWDNNSITTLSTSNRLVSI
jgi:hypothetical protein